MKWLILYGICSMAMVSPNRIISIAPVKYFVHVNASMPYAIRFKWKERMIPKLVVDFPESARRMALHKNTVIKNIEDTLVSEKKVNQRPIKLRHMVKIWGYDHLDDYLSYLTNLNKVSVKKNGPNITKMDLTNFSINAKEELEQSLKSAESTENCVNTCLVYNVSSDLPNSVKVNDVTKTNDLIRKFTESKDITAKMTPTGKISLFKLSNDSEQNYAKKPKMIEFSKEKNYSLIQKVQYPKHNDEISLEFNVNTNKNYSPAALENVYNESRELASDLFNISQIGKENENVLLTLKPTNFTKALDLASGKIEHQKKMILSNALPGAKLDQMENFVIPIKSDKVDDMRNILIRNADTKNISEATVGNADVLVARKARNIRKVLSHKIFENIRTKLEEINNDTKYATPTALFLIPRYQNNDSFYYKQSKANRNIKSFNNTDAAYLKRRLYDYTISDLTRAARDLRRKQQNIRNKAGIEIRVKPRKRENEMDQLGVEFIKYGIPYDTAKIINQESEIKVINNDDEAIEKLLYLVKNDSMKDLLKSVDTYINMKEMVFGRKNAGNIQVNVGNTWNSIKNSFVNLSSQGKMKKNNILTRTSNSAILDLFPNHRNPDIYKVIKRTAGPRSRSKSVDKDNDLIYKSLLSFDGRNKLIRSKRKAELKDEDMPYNFLELHSSRDSEINDANIHLLSEMLEQADVKSELNVEDLVEAISHKRHNYHDDSYHHLPSTSKPKPTYMSNHDGEVQSYHSHVAEMQWNDYSRYNNINAVDSDFDKDYSDKVVGHQFVDKKFDYDDFIMTTRKSVQLPEKISATKRAPKSAWTKSEYIDLYDDSVVNPKVEEKKDSVETTYDKRNITTISSPRVRTEKSYMNMKGNEQAELEYFYESNQVQENTLEANRGDFSFIESRPYLPRLSNIFLINTNGSENKFHANKLIRPNWNKFNENIKTSPVQLKHKFPFTINPVDHDIENATIPFKEEQLPLKQSYRKKNKELKSKEELNLERVHFTTVKSDFEKGARKIQSQKEIKISVEDTDYAETNIHSDKGFKNIDLTEPSFTHKNVNGNRMSEKNEDYNTKVFIETTTDTITRTTKEWLSEFDNYGHRPHTLSSGLHKLHVSKKDLMVGDKHFLGKWNQKSPKVKNNKTVGSGAPLQLWTKTVQKSVKRYIQPLILEEDNEEFRRRMKHTHTIS